MPRQVVEGSVEGRRQFMGPEMGKMQAHQHKPEHAAEGTQQQHERGEASFEEATAPGASTAGATDSKEVCVRMVCNIV
jgi:hypothetical protein